MTFSIKKSTCRIMLSVGYNPRIRKVVIEDKQRNAFGAALLAQDAVHGLAAFAAHMVGDPDHVEIELLVPCGRYRPDSSRPVRGCGAPWGPA